MITKPNTCAECPLFEKGKGFVPDKLATKGAQYVMVGEAPGKQEVAAGEPFIGQAGFVLKEWLIRAVPLLRLANEQGHITYANTLRCLPPEIQGRAYPRGEEKELAEKCCSQYDNLGEAHTVILLGENAQRKYFGPELESEDLSDRRIGRDVKGVMGRVGRVIERDGKRYIFAPHPAFILRQPSLAQHGQETMKIAANTEKMLEPDYLGWDSSIGELIGR